MGLELLDTPVRLTWDIPGHESRQALERLPAIARRIADGGVFFVTLQNRPLLNPAIEPVLATLASCQLLITCHGDMDEMTALSHLCLSGHQFLLDVAGFVDCRQGVDTGRLTDVVGAFRQCGCEPIFTLTPLRENLIKLPDLLRFCCDNRIAKFKLPNAHIGDSFHDYSPDDLPRWQDLAEFRKTWLDFKQTAPQLPLIEIHDLFLWEIMTPGEQQNRSEYGGCQAANSLGHIDTHGVVHPCAAWPQPLGKLPENDLADIWSGHQRHAVREQVDCTPEGCEGCLDLDICFGGCRGLAHHLNRKAGGRDLMCDGPR